MTLKPNKQRSAKLRDDRDDLEKEEEGRSHVLVQGGADNH
jgi:chitinase